MILTPNSPAKVSHREMARQIDRLKQALELAVVGKNAMVRALYAAVTTYGGDDKRLVLPAKALKGARDIVTKPDEKTGDLIIEHARRQDGEASATDAAAGDTAEAKSTG